MEYYGNKACGVCRKIFVIFESQAIVLRTNDHKNTIFTHNGNLISYTRKFLHNDYCTICSSEHCDCVYIEDGKYYTLSKHSSVTAIECAIKKPLRRKDAIIMSTSLGIFILTTIFRGPQELLFLRGITIDCHIKGYVTTVYSTYDGLYKSSEVDLQKSIFTIFTDDEKNVYLIDRNGNPMIYEVLPFISEEQHYFPYYGYKDVSQIYANDQIHIKLYGKFSGGIYTEFDKVEILTDVAPVGKHTKPALHADDDL